MSWATEVLTFQVAASSHLLSHKEFPGFPPTHQGPDWQRSWPCSGHATKGQWKDKQKQIWSKTSFIYMVYSSQPSCCNSSLSCQPSKHGAAHCLFLREASSYGVRSLKVGWGKEGSPSTRQLP